MLDRFSENARQAMSRARAAAERQRSGSVEAEHLLIGLLETDGCHAQAMLEAAGVDVASLLEALSTLLQSQAAGEEEGLAFSAVSKRALACAVGEAARAPRPPTSF